MMRTHGPDFFTDYVNGKIAFDDGRIRRVFEEWHKLMDAGYFIDGAAGLGEIASVRAVVWSDPGTTTFKEKAAMVLTSVDTVNDLSTEQQAELGFFRFPTMDPTMPVGEIVWPIGYIVSANAQNLLGRIGSDDG